MSERPEESAAGIARIEGYLMNQAALREARSQGEAFARALTWLGAGEQEEISNRFTEHHLRLHREMLSATAARARELRTEYEDRYASLRRRLTALVATALAVTTATVVVICRL